MARDPSLLDSNQPLAIAPAQPVIAHVQLRDLLICPREQGVVDYIVPRAIVEQDMHAPGAPTRVLSDLSFTPISLTYLPVGENDTLIAAGGQEKEIHLSLYTPHSSSSSSSSKPSRSRRTRQVWEYEDKLQGSINNSVLLTSLSLTRSHESSVEPRVGVSNNDGTVRLYDVPMRVQSSKRKLRFVGEVKLDVAINHSSISPDGRTLLSVGDSNKVYFHQLTGSSSLISFSPITTLTIPPPDFTPFSQYYSGLGSFHTSLTASFSTAFSGDGSKFAVASQEGVVGVWDVRSTGKPIRVWQTDKTRGMNPRRGNSGGGDGEGMYGSQRTNWWLSDDPWEWSRGRAPGWCVRSVKFNSGEGARMGKEVMAFTEHTSLVHLVDARTFETHDIIRVPTLLRPSRDPNAAPPRRPPSAATATSGASRRAASSVSVPPEPGSTGTVDANGASQIGGAGSARARAQAQRVLMRRGLPVSNTRTRAGSRAGAGAETSMSPTTRTTITTSNARRPRAATTAATGASTSNGSTNADASIGAGPRPTGSLDYLHPPIHTLQPLSHPPSPLRLSALPSSAVSSSSSTGSAGSGGPSRGETQLRAQAQPRTHRHTPTIGIVQALGDAFRIPLPSSTSSSSRPETPARQGSTSTSPAAGGSGSGATGGISRASSYSPPASIGDSTWRTLGGGAVVRGNWSPPRPGPGPASISASASAQAGSSAFPTSASGQNTITSTARASTNGTGSTAAGRPSARDARLRNYREWARLAVQELGRADVEPWRRQTLEERLGRGFEEEGDEEDGSYEREAERDGEGPTLEELIRDLRRGPVIHRPRRRRLRAQEEEEQGIVVVPDLGDRYVESEVHALLAGHGIQSRLAREDEHEHEEGTRLASDDDGQSTGGATSATANTINTAAATVGRPRSRTRTRSASPIPLVVPAVGSDDVNRLFEEVIQRRRARRARARDQTQTRGQATSGAGTESANEYAWMMADSTEPSYSSEGVGGAGAGRGGGGVVDVPSDDEHGHEHDDDVDMMDVDEIDHIHAEEDIVVDIEEEDSDGYGESHDHDLGPIYALGGGTGLAAGLDLAALGVGGDVSVRLDEDVFGTDLEYLDEDEEEHEQHRHHLPRQRRLGFGHYMEAEEEEDNGEGDEEHDHQGEEEVDGEEEEGYTGRRGIRQGGSLAALEDTPFASTSTASTSGSAVSTSSRYGARTSNNNQNKRLLTSKSSSHSTAASRRYGYYEDLDLAGLCFDPWGERMYVAGVGVGGRGGDIFGGEGGGWFGGGGHGHAHEGHGGEVGVGAVVEWGVRGAEKRWWVDDGWR